MQSIRVVLFGSVLFLCALEYAGAAVVEGYVWDGNSSLPITNAEIKVGNKTVLLSALTDTNGYYAVTNVPPDWDYTILANAPGYESDHVILEDAPVTQNFSLFKPTAGFLVPTRYQGVRHYTFNGEFCELSGGSAGASSGFFPDIEQENAAISNLLAHIGAGTEIATTPEEMWTKIRTVWEWLNTNTINASHPQYEDVEWLKKAMTRDGGWPSIDTLARIFDIYGFISLTSGCNHKAQHFTTLLHRQGIPKDCLAIAECRWNIRYTQHMYTVVFIAGRWINVDAVYIYAGMLEETFHSMPSAGGWPDYEHPYRLITIPGSSLSSVPVINRRAQNHPDIFINSPPNGSLTEETSLKLTGIASAQYISVSNLSNRVYPVHGGQFEVVLPLNQLSQRIEIGLDGSANSDFVQVDSLLLCERIHAPTIHVLDNGNGTLNLQWPGQSHCLYMIEQSDDLITWSTNSIIIGDYVSLGKNMPVTTKTSCFYRLRAESYAGTPVGMVEIPAGTNNVADPVYSGYSLMVDEPFYMDAYEVSGSLWSEVYDWAVTNDYQFASNGVWAASDHPVVWINWYDCAKWCNARSQMEGRTPCYYVSGSVFTNGQPADVTTDSDANGFRMPTHDEWEYAARGGVGTNLYPWGDTLTSADANYTLTYTTACGSYPPNAFGLHDMAGNVWEWCDNITFPGERGRASGGFNSPEQYLRCGLHRNFPSDGPMDNPYKSLGFRTICRP